MTKGQVLIIDDEPDIRELLEMTLHRMTLETQAAENLRRAQTLLRQHRFDLCLTDMRLPDGNGIDLVRHIQEHYPELPVAVITAHGNMASAIEALKAGAFDFLSKPIELQVLRDLVTNTLRLSAPSRQQERRSRHILRGESAAMRAIRGTIKKLSRSQAPVYISGESGTGKELVACLIHDKGPRAEKPFVPVNCGAIPTELMESEFFGHKKGSFTGAVADKEGLFQAAQGGTLLLDEVADLPLHMQVKLLRAIQEKAVRPVGAQKEIPTDVRILSATHRNLAGLVREGSFRQDLYYRINVIEVRVPSLRERQEDILPLAEHILSRLAKQTGKKPPTLSDNAIEALMQYPFPGNVRELENIIERALTLCSDNAIQVDDLQLPETAEPDDVMVSEDSAPLESHLNAIEKERIMKALEQARYNKTAAAKLLGISFRALRYRLEKLGLE